MSNSALEKGTKPSVQWSQESGSTAKIMGALIHETVPNLWAQLQQWQPEKSTQSPMGASLNVSLASVKNVDSSGMALLVNFIEHAKKHQCNIIYTNMPKQMITLFELSNINVIFSDHIQAESDNS